MTGSRSCERRSVSREAWTLTVSMGVSIALAGGKTYRWGDDQVGRRGRGKCKVAISPRLSPPPAHNNHHQLTQPYSVPNWHRKRNAQECGRRQREERRGSTCTSATLTYCSASRHLPALTALAVCYLIVVI